MITAVAASHRDIAFLLQIKFHSYEPLEKDNLLQNAAAAVSVAALIP